jgi:hypothetical protein
VQLPANHHARAGHREDALWFKRDSAAQAQKGFASNRTVPESAENQLFFS